MQSTEKESEGTVNLILEAGELLRSNSALNATHEENMPDHPNPKRHTERLAC